MDECGVCRRRTARVQGCNPLQGDPVEDPCGADRQPAACTVELSLVFLLVWRRFEFVLFV